MDRINAPFTDEQVENLNLFQRKGHFHPFTCNGERDDEAHVAYAVRHAEPDQGILVATNAGWHCPVCGYKQTWAHAFMADPEAFRMQENFMANLRARWDQQDTDECLAGAADVGSDATEPTR